jgi:glycosyltransferase involved in cell wall biosynthesis
VVTDGIDGFIIPICDVKGIVDKVAELSADPELLRKMSANARCKASEYSINKYCLRLLNALTEGTFSR